MNNNVERALQQIRQEQEDNRRRHVAQAAARAVDRSTRKKSSSRRGGGSKVKVPRAKKAPASSSQFHLHTKYSNRAGKNKGPKSAKHKLLYDFGLDEKGADRVAFMYISSPPNLPSKALDLRLIAEEAERTAGRQENSRQMAHMDISLPSNLSQKTSEALAIKIADSLRARRDGVPVFLAMHKPDDDNNNLHFHISHPLRKIQAVGKDGDFKMGDRIMHEQRPAVRKAAGLAATNHQELRDWRAHVGNLIADAVERETGDKMAAGRWRDGHLKLEQQVEMAAKRGDVVFVIDNVMRDATSKEGPNKSRWRTPSVNDYKRQGTEVKNSQATQKPNSTPAPKLLTKAAVLATLEEAKRQKIDDPEQLRLFMREAGIKVIWAKNESSNKVRGVSFNLADGPRYPGRDVDLPLSKLIKEMGWKGPPDYSRVHKKSDVQQYKAAKTAGTIKPPADALATGEKQLMNKAVELLKQAKENSPKKVTAKQPQKEKKPTTPHTTKTQKTTPQTSVDSRQVARKSGPKMNFKTFITSLLKQQEEQAQQHPKGVHSTRGKTQVPQGQKPTNKDPFNWDNLTQPSEEDKAKERQRQLDNFNSLVDKYFTLPERSEQRLEVGKKIVQEMYDNPTFKETYIEKSKEEEEKIKREKAAIKKRAEEACVQPEEPRRKKQQNDDLLVNQISRVKHTALP